MKKVILFLFVFIGFLSCDCPYNEYGEDKFERGYYNSSKNVKYDKLYADMLIGKWTCYYPMIITGIGEMIGSNGSISYEMKEMRFINQTKCDITIQAAGSIERRTYTFSYLYDGNTLRFSRNNRTIILSINGFLYPELYLRDSFGRYTLKKDLAAGC